jgi:hypothetical protein
MTEYLTRPLSAPTGWAASHPRADAMMERG